MHVTSHQLDSAISPTSTTASDPICLQRFQGDIDAQTAADFAAALDRVSGQKPGAVILDMSGVDFLSASGLALLVEFCDGAALLGWHVVCVGRRAVSRPIEACGFGDSVAVFDSLEGAGRALATLADD